MAVAKRSIKNIEEIGGSLDKMGKNNRPSMITLPEGDKESEEKSSKGGRKRISYWTAEERRGRTSVATFLNKEELRQLKMRCLLDGISQENLVYDALMAYLKSE